MATISAANRASTPAPSSMRQIFFLLFFVLHCASAMAQNAQDFSPKFACQIQTHETFVNLQPCTEKLETSQLQGWMSMLKSQFGEFAEDGDWVRVRIASIPQQSIMDLGIPDAFHLEVFVLTQSGITQLLKLDEHSVFQDRLIAHRSLLIPLAATEVSTELLVHYRTHGKTPLFLRLFSEAEFDMRDTLGNLINGAIFGFLIVVIPLLVTVFRSVQNRSYASYAGVVLANLALLAQIEGYGFQFLWPNSPTWNMKVPAFAGLILMFCHILFAIQFLQMRQRLVKLYLWHIAGLWIIALIALLHGFGNNDDLAMVATISYATLASYSAIQGVRHAIPAAKFYLIGTLMQVFFVALMVVMSLTVGNPFPQISMLNYPKIGYFGEAIFFAAAVWNQIRLFTEQQAELRVRRLAETEQLLLAEQSKILALEKAKQQQMQLAAASHDIAQPLASLRFALAALGQRTENKAIASHVENTLNYAQNLLKDLILQTRDEALASDNEIVVHRVFEQLAQEFEGLAQQKGLRLAIHDSHIRVQGSSLLLYRILSNLLANAIRYTSKGRVVLGVRRRAHAIEFQVWDTGYGIAAHTRDALLRAFAQGADAKQTGQGFGLGLFIVNTLCQQCGYQLQIHSELGKGSGFCLIVPLN